MTEASLMQQARTAIREDRQVDARRLLRQVIHEDPTNHAAWLLLAQATPDKKLAAEYVERARLLQPESPLVKQAGDRLASGRRFGPSRRQFNWRLALPLAGVALIVALLLAGRASQGSLQNLFALQDEDADVVLAVAEAAQFESRTASQSETQVVQNEAPEAGVESAARATATVSRRANADTEPTDAAREEQIAFQPVVIAGSDEALPAAIIRGIESSVSSSAEEDAAVGSSALSSGAEDVETIAPSDTEEVNVEAVKETSSELEIIEEVDAGEVTESADDNQDVVVEEAESSAPETADNNQDVTVEEAGNESAETAGNNQEVVFEEIESEVASEEETDSNSAVPAPGERWIDVNLTTQMLTAYEGETPVLYSAISSGLWQFPTVTGEFRTWIKYERQDMTGYHLDYDYELEDVPHVMYFFEDYAIHGAYWHNNFGTPMSHGCVNMNLVDAEWLYNWAPLGTRVSVHN